MNIATTITALRILLAPVFCIIFITNLSDGAIAPVPAIILVALFIIMEITDLLDGMIARRTGTVSDFGKLFDPFADSFLRLTYFFTFLYTGLMPGWVFLLVLYRDLGVSFIRLLAMKKGVAMSAQISGKIKAVIYAIAGGAGLLVPASRNLLPENIHAILNTVMDYSFIICGLVAVWTSLDYGLAYRRMQNGAAKR